MDANKLDTVGYGVIVAGECEAVAVGPRDFAACAILDLLDDNAEAWEGKPVHVLEYCASSQGSVVSLERLRAEAGEFAEVSE